MVDTAFCEPVSGGCGGQEQGIHADFDRKPANCRPEAALLQSLAADFPEFSSSELYEACRELSAQLQGVGWSICAAIDGGGSDLPGHGSCLVYAELSYAMRDHCIMQCFPMSFVSRSPLRSDSWPIEPVLIVLRRFHACQHP